MASKAKKVFAEYIAIQSCKEVSSNPHTNTDPYPQGMVENTIKQSFTLSSH